MHRLDRDTSGLLVVAKTEAAHAELSRMIREREVTRRYLALVDGRPPAASGTIDAPLGRDRRRRTVMSSDTDKPREAITHFELLEALPRTTLLDVALQTGRTHQIRAHMQAIGHPVCGDPRYGGSGAGRRLGLERQFLHANLLMFRHPITAGRSPVRVQTTRRSAPSTRRSQAGASVRRARRTLISRRGGSLREPPRFRFGLYPLPFIQSPTPAGRSVGLARTVQSGSA